METRDVFGTVTEYLETLAGPARLPFADVASEYARAPARRGSCFDITLQRESKVSAPPRMRSCSVRRRLYVT